MLENTFRGAKALTPILSVILFTACSSQHRNEQWNAEVGGPVEKFTGKSKTLDEILGPPGTDGYQVYVRTGTNYKNTIVEDHRPYDDSTDPPEENCTLRKTPFNLLDRASEAIPKESYITQLHEGYVKGPKGYVFFMRSWVYDGKRAYFWNGKPLERLIDECLNENNKNIWTGALVEQEMARRKKASRQSPSVDVP